MIEVAENSDIWENGIKPIFTSDWEEVKSIIKAAKQEGKETAVTLSSVIHEVYSYGNDESVATFWKNLFHSGFDYIIIRDMMVSNQIAQHSSKPQDIDKVYKSQDPHIAEFESVWGSISDYRNLLHYLLKYRYNKNWFRELRENYLPITLENMLSKIPTDLYSYEYYQHYVLPFIQKSVKKEFGINLKENTHIKLILKRK